MRTISLTVNGKPVTAQVEPRTHLADFLREQLLLTGTHIGCEHGICGACTVVIDGEIGRSCITYAVQCDGAEVTTVEGFADDPLMVRLRAAFTAEHALQCGYCTPGMIIAARDLIRRKGQLDDRQIREEMSGNLCRCTGYMGIVSAIRQVGAETPDLAGLPPSKARIGPAPGPDAAVSPQDQPAAAGQTAVGQTTAAPSSAPRPSDTRPSLDAVSEEGMTTLTESFTVQHPVDKVWAFFGDLQTVAGCLPGARLTAQDGDHIEGEMRVKLGPMTPSFAGEGRISRDEPARRARIIGQAKDARSASRARGRIDYALHDSGDGGTRVEIEIGYALTGALAQFSRGAIATDLVKRLTAAFAKNLEAAIAGDGAPAAGDADAQALDAGGLLGAVVWARIKGWLDKLFGRG